MRLVHAVFVFVTLMASAAPSYGDGLIHKLPKDGTSVDYKLSVEMSRGDTNVKGEGTLIIRSVGSTKTDGEACRWIEFRMEFSADGREQKTIAKVLVPEKHLAAGKSPIDHVKTFWLKMNDGDAQEIDDVKGNRGGPLVVFLAGPIDGRKKLKADVVDSKLGKLKCEGISSSRKFTQGTQEMQADVTTRLNDKVPFGVASSEIKMTISRGGREQVVTIKLVAESVGSGAKSELPEKS